MDGLTKRDQILSSALEVFSLYGFKRTNMADIAEKAGVSRAAIYTHFKNKEEIFRAIVSETYRRALRNMEQCFSSYDSFAEALFEAIEKKYAAFELVFQSPHGQELMYGGSEVAADLYEEMVAQYYAVLAKALADAEAKGEITLTALGIHFEDMAGLFHKACYGVEKNARSFEELRKDLHDLCSLFLAGWGARGMNDNTR